jgi:hypothetical protein
VEWRSSILRDATAPEEWKASLLRNDSTSAEWRLSLLQSSTVSTDWAALAVWDATAPDEWTASIARNRHMPIDASATLSASDPFVIDAATSAAYDGRIPSEITATAAAGFTTPVDYYGMLSSSATVPSDVVSTTYTAVAGLVEAGSSGLSASGFSAAEWSQSLPLVSPSFSSEWGGSTISDWFVTPEWLGRTYTEWVQPVDWRGAVLSSASIPADAQMPVNLSLSAWLDRSLTSAATWPTAVEAKGSPVGQSEIFAEFLGATGVSGDANIPIAWTSIAAATQTSQVDSLALPWVSFTSPISSGATATSAYQSALDAQSGTSALSAYLSEWRGSLAASGILPAESLSSGQCLYPVQVEWPASYQALIGIPADWSGAAATELSSVVSAEWGAAQRADLRGAADWASSLSASTIAAPEYGRGYSSDRAITVEFGRGYWSQADAPFEAASSPTRLAVVPAEFTGAVAYAIQSDGSPPVEWLTTSSIALPVGVVWSSPVTLSTPVSIGHSSAFSVAVPLAGELSATSQIGMTAPADILAGQAAFAPFAVERRSQISTETVALYDFTSPTTSVSGDAIFPLEISASVWMSETFPSAWAGVQTRPAPKAKGGKVRPYSHVFIAPVIVPRMGGGHSAKGAAVRKRGDGK